MKHISFSRRVDQQQPFYNPPADSAAGSGNFVDIDNLSRIIDLCPQHIGQAAFSAVVDPDNDGCRYSMYVFCSNDLESQPSQTSLTDLASLFYGHTEGELS